jgi:hypothetical protein
MQGSRVLLPGLLVVPLLALMDGACGGAGTLTGGGGSGGRGTSPTGAAGQNVIGPAGSGGGFVDWTQACATIYLAHPVLPDILIALDASASMNDGLDSSACAGGCGPDSKWAAATAAINAAVTAPAQRATWGLALFGLDQPNACDAFDTSYGGGSLLISHLAAQTGPNGGALGGTQRPTRGAIVEATRFLSVLPGPNQKLIVLLTDGVPGCAANTSVADDTPATVDAITYARTAGVPTFVIGVGTAGGPADASLIMMGSAGGYFSASSAATIYQELDRVADLFSGCTFAVPTPPLPELTFRSNIAVQLNGTELPYDPINGWGYLDSSEMSVQLYGAACTAAKQDNAVITFQFKCIAV